MYVLGPKSGYQRGPTDHILDPNFFLTLEPDPQEWDLIELTQNYLKMLLQYLVECEWVGRWVWSCIMIAPRALSLVQVVVAC